LEFPRFGRHGVIRRRRLPLGVECRRRRLKKTSMYSKTSVRSSAFEGQLRPWMSSFLSVAEKLSATALS
jgi:hypothetical protein